MNGLLFGVFTRLVFWRSWWKHRCGKFFISRKFGTPSRWQPVLLPVASGSWSGNSWSGTASCPTNSNSSFSANIEGPGGSKTSCQSNIVPAVPQTPTRSCSASASRQGRPGFCNLAVTINGTITGSPRVTPYSPGSWSRTRNIWSTVIACPINKNTSYSVNVTGADKSSWVCGSNKISAVSP